MYKEIKLGDSFQDYINNSDEQLPAICNLSKINIFVGANNSGKSRFLRSLSKIKNPAFKKATLKIEDIKKELSKLNQDVGDLVIRHIANIARFNIVGFKNNAENLEDLRVASYFENLEYFDDAYFSVDPNEKNLINLKRLLQSLKNNGIHVSSYRGSFNESDFNKEIKDLLSDKWSHIFQLIEKYIKHLEYDRYYLPILRSLNCFDSYTNVDEKDFYNDRINTIYQFTDNEGVQVFTGQVLYKKIRTMLLGHLNDRKIVADYEKFLSKKFFEGKPVTIIPREKFDVLFIKIGDEEERPIYDLGDGLQTIIIITFPLFESKRGLYFIEEPETHLHPSMQRKLIEVLIEHPRHQYFITTHSNHILDLTLDFNNISIYSFDKKRLENDKLNQQFIVEQVSSGDSQLLQLLGVQNSSVFTSNATIWVEGITDRWYIRKFLQLYQENFKEGQVIISEDVDYSFVEYGGSNIVHWSFLDEEECPINVERLCSRLILLTDNDNPKKGTKKDKRKQKLKKILGQRYINLKSLEIENLLLPVTLFRALKKFDKSFVSPDNLSANDYKMEKLGRFIDREIYKLPESKQKFADKNGTISRKLEFCKKVIEEMTYEELSKEAKDICEKIYKFVIEQKK
jgi:predicted ATP-dependent endonuclease of OLD family